MGVGEQIVDPLGREAGGTHTAGWGREGNARVARWRGEAARVDGWMSRARTGGEAERGGRTGGWAGLRTDN